MFLKFFIIKLKNVEVLNNVKIIELILYVFYICKNNGKIFVFYKVYIIKKEIFLIFLEGYFKC